MDYYLQNPESRIQNLGSRSLAQKSSCIFTPPPPRVHNFPSPSRSSKSTIGFWILDSGWFTPHLTPPSPDMVYQSIQMDSVIPHACDIVSCHRQNLGIGRRPALMPYTVYAKVELQLAPAARRKTASPTSKICNTHARTHPFQNSRFSVYNNKQIYDTSPGYSRT